tara:strand:+ start:188 stop:463 length:276 start_codon:yes stop_codon:yes gene_type:complete
VEVGKEKVDVLVSSTASGKNNVEVGLSDGNLALNGGELSSGTDKVHNLTTEGELSTSKDGGSLNDGRLVSSAYGMNQVEVGENSGGSVIET